MHQYFRSSCMLIATGFLMLAGSNPILAASPSDFVVFNYDWGSDGNFNNGTNNADTNPNGQTGRNVMGQLYVPTDYDPSKSYPIYIFLHGSGEQGQNDYIQTNDPSNTATYYVQRNTAQINGNINALLSQAKSRDFFIYAPQSRTASYNSTELQGMVSMVARAADTYNIDTSRMYVTGLSAGGGGTLNFAKSYNDLFAGFAPLSVSHGIAVEDAPAMVGTPIWFFHARNDTTVAASLARNSINRVRAAQGLPNLTFPPSTDTTTTYVYDDGTLRYTEYPTGGHSNTVWAAAYNTGELYEWLDTKARPLTQLEAGKTIYFDMGGADATDSQGRRWNGVSVSGAQSYTTLEAVTPFAFTSDGQRSTVSLTIDEAFTNRSSETTSVMGYENVSSFSWYKNKTGGDARLKLQGLTPGEQYDLTLFAGTASSTGGLTRYTITGGNGDQVIETNTLTSPTELMMFSGVTADAAGHIFITMGVPDGSSATRSRLNFFSITAVPEPASLSLLMLGGLILVRRRRNADVPVG